MTEKAFEASASCVRDAAGEDFDILARPVLAAARVHEMDAFIQHGDTTTLAHCVAVAYYSLRLVDRLRLRVDRVSLVRGALLHDYFLYDWHDPDPVHRLHGFRHPGFALRNAERDFDLNATERDLIAHHMFPLTPVPPHHLEALIVCLVDKGCSTYETFGRGAYRLLMERQVSA